MTIHSLTKTNLLSIYTDTERIHTYISLQIENPCIYNLELYGIAKLGKFNEDNLQNSCIRGHAKICQNCLSKYG